MARTKYAAKQTTAKMIEAANRRERRAWQAVNEANQRVTCAACGFSHLDQTTPEYAAWAKAAQDRDSVVLAAVGMEHLTIDQACADYGYDRAVVEAQIAASRAVLARA